jgi:hypothetical protein
MNRFAPDAVMMVQPGERSEMGAPGWNGGGDRSSRLNTASRRGVLLGRTARKRPEEHGQTKESRRWAHRLRESA